MAKATSLQEVFQNMPARFAADKAGDMRAVIQFELSGEGGGQYYVTIADRACTSTEGTAANPTMTLMAAAADYLGVVNGDLNPMQAFMQGKVKIKGDMSVAMKMQTIFT